jgi:hypothetical protein
MRHTETELKTHLLCLRVPQRLPVLFDLLVLVLYTTQEEDEEEEGAP